jgi:hypothetical protein
MGAISGGRLGGIARELAGLADADGKVKLEMSDDEAARAKTAALLKGLGEGLGVALGQLFQKWADKVQINTTPSDAPAEPSAESADAGEPPPATPGDDPTKPTA